MENGSRVSFNLGLGSMKLLVAALSCCSSLCSNCRNYCCCCHCCWRGCSHHRCYHQEPRPSHHRHHRHRHHHHHHHHHHQQCDCDDRASTAATNLVQLLSGCEKILQVDSRLGSRLNKKQQKQQEGELTERRGPMPPLPITSD